MTGPGHAIVILLRHIGLLHNNSGTYAVSTPLKCQVNSSDQLRHSVGPTSATLAQHCVTAGLSLVFTLVTPFSVPC